MLQIPDYDSSNLNSSSMERAPEVSNKLQRISLFAKAIEGFEAAKESHQAEIEIEMASLDGRRSRVWGTEYGVQRHVSGSYPRQDDAEVRFHKRGTLHRCYYYHYIHITL